MRRLLTLLLVTSSILCAQAQSILYGNYTGNQKLQTWGTCKAEVYSVAMRVDRPELAGARITALRIPVNPYAHNTTEYTAFLTRLLKAEEGRATGTICNVDFTPEGIWTTITLPEPYTITDQPFYCGYTFRVTTCADENDEKPLMLMVDQVDMGLNITSSRTYRRWEDISPSLGGALAMQVLIEGLPWQHSASIVRVEDKRVQVGQEDNFRVRIANNGMTPIGQLHYTYAINGTTIEGDVDANIPAEYYGTMADVRLPIPAIAATGSYYGDLAITHVDGYVNMNEDATGWNKVTVMEKVPVKRPLMEEFTGTWCGFCPAGFVGMREMNRRYPGEFICASYHNGDAMQITTAYPVSVGGFPWANFDRHHSVDAYLGDMHRDMGIDETWQLACQENTYAAVDVDAELDTRTGKVTVNAQYTMCDDISDSDLGVAYIITADGLQGTTSRWRQHNYFSPQYENGDYSTMYLEGMQMFNEGPEYLFLTYDDVVVAQSGAGGATITGVIPASCAAYSTYSHTYSFDTSKMVSNFGDKENLVQNPDRLHAIALVYDRKEGRVLNCNRADVRLVDGTGIQATPVTAQPQAIYNLQGQRISRQQRGIQLRRDADGTVHKVMVR